MRFPKLTPLQSRLAASVTAVVVLMVIYLSLDPSHFAYAAELDVLDPVHEDHNHRRLAQDGGLVLEELEELEERDADAHDADEEDGYVRYEPEFAAGVGRDIVGRQADSYEVLTGNSPGTNILEAGKTMLYRFQNASVWANFSAEMPGLPEIEEKSSVSLSLDAAELKKRTLEGDGDDDDDEVGEEFGYLEKRQDNATTRTVYLSMNVCTQPYINGTTTASPPQLTMYVSTSDDNKDPGPDSTGEQATATLVGGFVSYSANVTGDVYISVAAPTPLPDGYAGDWQYEVAASIDAPYHTFNERDPTNAFVYLVDSDTTSALLVTDNLTQSNPDDEDYQRWMKAGNPFQLYAYSTNNSAISGLERSYCGLNRAWISEPTSQISGMTTRGLGNKPKEQFYVQGLNGSTNYNAFPVMYGNSTAAGAGVVGGGGQVWSSVGFTTKSDGNCQVIFNLTFCSEVAYAVPSNPYRYNLSSLISLYDSNSQGLFQAFNYSLQQIPCNTTNTAQYSLAKTCQDCADDYKNWLCAVTIPRCEDFSSTDSWLQPRNIAAPFFNGTNINDTAFGSGPNLNASTRNRLYANSSRNRLIDSSIQPGPYKEVLPCEDLCFSLMQSCPAGLGFMCPVAGKGLEKSYGSRWGNGNGRITCSYLGAVYYINAASRMERVGVVVRSVGMAAAVAVAVMLV